MPSLFSSRSVSAPTAAQQSVGFSDVGGPASSVNLSFGNIGKSNFHPVFQFTDQGALKTAVDISRQSLAGIELLGSRLEGALTTSVGAIAAQNQQALAAAAEANRTELENLGLTAIKWGALVIGAYLVARAVGAFQ